MILALAMVVPPAPACSCVSPGNPSVEFWSPIAESVGVPTNAKIVFEIWDQDEASYYAPDNLTVVADGVEDPIEFDISTIDDGDHQVNTIRFSQALPADTRIDLWLDGAVVPMFGFTTGSDTDLSAPTWDGTFSVDQSNLGGTCGRSHNISVEMSGVSTDENDEPLVIAESRTGGSWSVVTPISSQYIGFELSYSDICGGDPSVLAHHPRSFDVSVVDMAGNASETFRVYTGCGCASVPDANSAAAFAAWALCGILGVRRRSGVAHGHPLGRSEP